MKYKLRAECLIDIDAFVRAARLRDYSINRINGYPDCELEFSSDDSIEKLKKRMEKIPDSHVMKETLQELADYTGERIFLKI